MLRMERVGMCVGRIILRIAGLVLMIMIGAVQAVGTIITAMCAVVLKSISAIMIFVTLLFLIFGLFTWTRTLVVLVIAGCMFWAPEFLAAFILGLSVIQAKLMNLLDV